MAILLGFQLAGHVLHVAAGVPLPAGVLGLILFAACLFLGLVRLEWVEPAAGFLLRHMLLFFAPVVVGVVAFTPLLRREWPAVTVGLVGSFLVVLLVTGWVASWLTRERKGRA